MVLAKLALGFCGTIVLASTYIFHEGILRIDEDHGDGRHVHVWVPAAIVPMALHVIPRNRIERAARSARLWLPTLRALTKELERYPEAELVEVRDGKQHVHIRTHDGKLLIDVTEPDANVHVVCPLVMMEDVSEELVKDTSGV
jgi:hypothetical protein